MNTEIEREIEQILRQEILLGSDRAISLDATLGELGLDSLAVINLITAVENAYGVEIAEQVLTAQNPLTLRDLTILVDNSPRVELPEPRPAFDLRTQSQHVHRIELLEKEFSGRGLLRTAAWAALRVSWPWLANVYSPSVEYVLLERLLDTTPIPVARLPAGIVLRPYLPSDRSALNALWPQYLLGRAGCKIDRWLEAGASAIVAAKGQEIVGLNIVSSTGEHGEITVRPGQLTSWGIYLREAPDARGQGIGIALLAYSLAEDRAKGFRAQLSSVKASNTPMLLAMTQLLGFQRIGSATRTRLFGVNRWSWESKGQTGRGFRLVI